eukprot:5132275-Alexandrium_andersonii.AAC.1
MGLSRFPRISALEECARCASGYRTQLLTLSHASCVHVACVFRKPRSSDITGMCTLMGKSSRLGAVSYTHLRAHETSAHL